MVVSCYGADAAAAVVVVLRLEAAVDWLLPDLPFVLDAALKIKTEATEAVESAFWQCEAADCIRPRR